MGVRFRLAVLVALLLALLVIAPRIIREHTLAEFEARTMALAQLTASSLAPALDFDDPESATKHLDQLAVVDEARHAELRDRDGALVARWRRVSAPVETPQLEVGRPLFSGDFLYVKIPVPSKATRGATLSLVSSVTPVSARIDDAQRTVRGASVVVLALSLLASFVLGSTLTRPLQRITDVAQRIGRGDPGAAAELDTARQDEVGVLARELARTLSALGEQRAMARVQGEASMEGMLVSAHDGRLLSHNERFCTLWDLSPDVLGRLDLQSLLALLRRAVNGDAPLLEPPTGDEALHAALVLRDERTLVGERRPITMPDGSTGWGFYFRDVSDIARAKKAVRELNAQLERRVEERTRELGDANAALRQSLQDLEATQARLVVADRRASIGRLAAGVAHEGNNPLAFILANIQFALSELGADREPNRKELLETLQESLAGGQRVAFIVKSLKAMSRSDEVSPDEVTPTDLVACVETALKLASPELRARAQIVRAFEAHPVVAANPVRLGQVFLNLLLNAGNAMSEPSRAHRVELTVREAGDWCSVDVADTGHGMTEEVRRRLFEPFFSTRAGKGGTGLGLSVSQGIVQDLGGSIEVRSTPGEGATFTVRLPVARVSQQAAERGEGTAAEVARCRRRQADHRRAPARAQA